jgi:NAD(P)-dependent dehydrogenase (short-subunit alcohol dehydrogenase family)
VSGELPSRSALVAGGGRGIGRAIAVEGANVALVSRTRAEFEAVATEIAATGHGPHAVFVADDRDPAQIGEAARGVAARLDAVDAHPGAMVGGNAYAASKAALEAHVVNLAAEVEGSGVTVNAFRPGAVDTAMQAWTPLFEERRSMIEKRRTPWQ